MTQTTPDRRAFLIGSTDDGKRLDHYLVDMLPEWSRSAITRLIRDGSVLVNEAVPRKPGQALEEGDAVVVVGAPPSTEVADPVAEKMPLEVIYEDEDILVVDKPAGVPVHPGLGHAGGTLVNALLGRGGGLSEAGGRERPGIVHRLDMDTSGIILVAKTDAAHRSLAKQFRDRTVAKVYITLLRGALEPEEGIIEAPIARDPDHRQRMAVEPGGREAVTEYEVLAHLRGYTLVEARPKTGRPHQIRVHFASLRHPVTGDRVYARGHVDPVPRLFLHAHRLRFLHPRTGIWMDLTSPLAKDLADALREMTAGTSDAELTDRFIRV